MAESDPQAPNYEAEHVHSVYEEIASHFSSTRYKPWPIVERFLQSQPPGSIGADVGCGNGKYLTVNPGVFILGSDRSTNLVHIAKQHKRHSVLVADNLDLPHPRHVFDFAISIAVIHHLSTGKRRVEGVRSVLELLRMDEGNDGGNGGGKALIYVWALEQKDSRRGWDEGHEQDVMVPWVVKGKKDERDKGKGKGKGRKKKSGGGDAGRGGGSEEGGGEGKKEGEVQEPEKTMTTTTDDKTYLRYYHLYRKGELESDIEEAGGVVLESGYEKDNWWAIARLKGSS